MIIKDIKDNKVTGDYFELHFDGGNYNISEKELWDLIQDNMNKEYNLVLCPKCKHTVNNFIGKKCPNCGEW